LYASSFSGFYLPLMMVLWLLILRGVSVEFRNHVDSPVWKPFWDAGFMLSGALLAVFYGAALGNVVRGAPLDPAGRFFLPLWTDFGVNGPLGILDWYTVPVGVAAFAALVQHGALWVALKTEGDVARRASNVAGAVWFLVAAMTVLVTILTFRVQPQAGANLSAHPWGYVFPLLAVGGLVAVLARGRNRRPVVGFLGSCAYLAGMLSSAAFGIFPYVLPARPASSLGLTIYNTAAGAYGLRVGLYWYIPGMLLALGYFVFTYRHFRGKVRLEAGGY
jgi:cytochrome d ubiquinol oxidase subunit II